MKREKNTSPGGPRRFFAKIFRNKAPFIYAAAAFLCAVSFFLPGIVLGARDDALERSGETVAVDEVQLSLLSDLTAAQRLALVGDSTATTVYLSSGRDLTEEDARTVADAIVRDMVLLDKSASSFDVTLTPELRVASDDSALLTWTAVYSSDSRDVTVVFDEDARCLSYRQSSYPHGKDALSGVGVTNQSGSDYSAPESEAADETNITVVPGGKYTEKVNDGSGGVTSYESYISLISRLLDPLGVVWDNVAVSSPQSVSAIIPYENTYYSMPVSMRSVELDGLTYALHISVNM